MNSACQGCLDRTATCHGICEKYKAECAERARLRKAHDADFILSQYCYQKSIQLSKRAEQKKENEEGEQNENDCNF